MLCYLAWNKDVWLVYPTATLFNIGYLRQNKWQHTADGLSWLFLLLAAKNDNNLWNFTISDEKIHVVLSVRAGTIC